MEQIFLRQRNYANLDLQVGHFNPLFAPITCHTLFSPFFGKKMGSQKKEGESDCEYMFHLVFNWWLYVNPIYNINRFVLQELGILLGGCLTVKN